MSERRSAEEGWWVALDGREVRRAPVSITRHGRRIVLWRDDAGTLLAHAAQCPHRGVDLGAGRVVKGELECAYHGFRFDRSGGCTATPCEGAQKTPPSRLRLTPYPSREERGLVWIFFGDARPDDELPPLPWPRAMPDDDRGSCTRSMVWRVPFPRVMEAMLDLHHAPFAHRKLLSGFGSRLDPWHVRREDGAVHAEGWMRQDRGEEEWDGRSGQRFAIEARPPGVLHLAFSRWLGGFVGCTPIDATSTHIVVRFAVPVPVIGSLLAWIAITGELGLVQPDDERMQLLTLRETNDLSECTLVRADAAIVEWQRLTAPAREKKRSESATAQSDSPLT